MPRRLITLLLLLFAGILIQCSHGEPGLNDPNPGIDINRSLTDAEIDLVQADNKFAFKIFREVNRGDNSENVFISPFSISMALGMTYNGADGTTKSAMENALELTGMSVEEINQSYLSLMEMLTQIDKDVDFSVANSIWYRLGLPVMQDFIDVNKTYFLAEVAEADFESPETPLRINGWVDTNTGGKIKKIVPDQIPGNVQMYLINAIYFKAAWKYQFKREETKVADFHLGDGEYKSVNMMHMDNKAKYYLGDNYWALELPYGSGSYNMTILMPGYESSVDELISSIDHDDWSVIKNSMLESEESSINLPRFKVEYEKSLVDVLKNLGMEVAFGGGADFSKMTGSPDLFISDVRHKTFVEVNEEGTEAAAVTSVVMTDSFGPPNYFHMDRPFVYIISDNKTGAILFMGKMLNPEE